MEARGIAKEHEVSFGDASYWKEWHEERKLDAMRRAIKEKFEQHSDLKAKLLATGQAILVEENDVSGFWYVGQIRGVGMALPKILAICLATSSLHIATPTSNPHYLHTPP